MFCGKYTRPFTTGSAFGLLAFALCVHIFCGPLASDPENRRVLLWAFTWSGGAGIILYTDAIPSAVRLAAAFVYLVAFYGLGAVALRFAHDRLRLWGVAAAILTLAGVQYVSYSASIIISLVAQGYRP